MSEGKLTLVEDEPSGLLEPGQLMVEHPHVTTFVGTRSEIGVVLRRLFDNMETFIIGQTSEANDDGTLRRDGDGRLVPTPEQADRLDAFERTVWQIDVTPLERIAKEPCRRAFMADAERIRTERELYELLGRGSLAKGVASDE